MLINQSARDAFIQKYEPKILQDGRTYTIRVRGGKEYTLNDKSGFREVKFYMNIYSDEKGRKINNLWHCCIFFWKMNSENPEKIVLGLYKGKEEDCQRALINVFREEFHGFPIEKILPLKDCDPGVDSCED